MRTILDKLHQKKNLTRGEVHAVMTEIMSGNAAESDIREFLVGLNAKGFTVEEITAAAAIMRKYVLLVQTDREVVLDTCGTGGDGKHTFNISTATALVVAGCGVVVAKHGNRSVSSRCGSADVLEALGVNLAFSYGSVKACLETVGIAFLFAQNHHPAMKYVAPVRKALGVKTIFNILGPLTNPARAENQMMGVYSRHLTEQMAQALHYLGARRAVVAHGADGLDEISTTDKTFISALHDGQVSSYEITPEDFGFQRAGEPDLKGGDVSENAAIILDILKGAKGPKRDIVVLNSAFALYAAEQVASPKEAIEIAAASIDSGRALAKLEALKEFSHRV